MSTRSWSHSTDIALVSEPDRVAVLRLSRLNDPPVVLTGTAAAIWEAVDGSRDDEGVVACVAERYAVPVDEIRNAVLTFLRHLASCQLVSRT
jgi:pyrroloquinoline quinone biosynthesis protein D